METRGDFYKRKIAECKREEQAATSWGRKNIANYYKREADNYEVALNNLEKENV